MTIFPIIWCISGCVCLFVFVYSNADFRELVLESRNGKDDGAILSNFGDCFLEDQECR